MTTCSHMCFFSRNRPLEKSPHRTCRTFRGESDSSILEVVGGLLVIVFEASRRTPENAARTIETLPDKKMRVASLHNPREYDDRPPPDVGHCLDLVIPRNEEPRKKIGSQVRLSTWKNITNKVIHLLVKLTRILVNY